MADNTRYGGWLGDLSVCAYFLVVLNRSNTHLLSTGSFSPLIMEEMACFVRKLVEDIRGKMRKGQTISQFLPADAMAAVKRKASLELAPEAMNKRLLSVTEKP